MHHELCETNDTIFDGSCRYRFRWSQINHSRKSREVFKQKGGVPINQIAASLSLTDDEFTADIKEKQFVVFGKQLNMIGN